MTEPSLQTTPLAATETGIDRADPPRIGLWYPQHVESLPYPAQIMRRGVSHVTFAWTGNGQNPTEPSETNIDFWLLICDGPPPAPPDWRFLRAGRWAIYPGSAARWTSETRAAVEAWRPELVLSDLLPDEITSTLWFEWRTEQAFAWMPTWEDGLPARNAVPIVVHGADCAQRKSSTLVTLLAEALGSRSVSEETLVAKAGMAQAATVAGSVVLYSVNPIISGVVLRNAVKLGSRAIVLDSGNTASLRGALLGGKANWAGSLDAVSSEGARLGSVLRPILRALSAKHELSPSQVPNWSWFEWLDALARPEGSGHELPTAADLIISHALRASGEPMSPSIPVRQWLAQALNDLWQRHPAAARLREAAAATFILSRLELTAIATEADIHMLARLYALRGDAYEAEQALQRFTETTGGEPRELPGAIALALWRRGLGERAQTILRSWAERPARTPMACFVLAVASELLGVKEILGPNLDRLLASARGFLQHDEEDGRWMMAALVTRVAGDDAGTSRWLAKAASHPAGNTHLMAVCADTLPRTDAVDPRWTELFDRDPSL